MGLSEERLCELEQSLTAALLCFQRGTDTLACTSEATQHLPMSEWPLLISVFDARFAASSALDATGNRLFELRKKVAFCFAELCHSASDGCVRDDVSHGLSSLLSSPIMVAASATGDAAIVQSDAVENVLVRALVEQQCLSAGLLIRSALKVPTFSARLLKPHVTTTPFDDTLLGALLVFQLRQVHHISPEASEEDASRPPPQHPQNSSNVAEIAENSIGVNVADASVFLEAWRCIDALLTTNPPMTSEFLRAYFVEFLRCVCLHLDARQPPPCPADAAGPPCGHMPPRCAATFIGKWQMLRCMTTLLGDPKFGKLRTMLAESPALLLALVPHINEPSTHLRFEAYHALKVCIAKPNKPTPIRYLLWLNRDALIRFINAHHQDVVRQLEEEHGGHHVYTMAQREEQDVREGERDMLLDRLVNLQPLSREEMVLLDV